MVCKDCGRECQGSRCDRCNMSEYLLNPNCSEIVARLNGEEFGVWTDSFPNECLETMVRIMKDTGIGDADLEFVDNNGGGGWFEFIEACLPIAIKVVKKKLTLTQGKELEEKIWHGESVPSTIQTKIDDNEL